MSTPVVVITGAGGGMGREIARRFTRDGWQVAATDLDDLLLSSHAAAITGADFSIDFGYSAGK